MLNSSWKQILVFVLMETDRLTQVIEEETAKELLELRSGVIDEVVTDEVYVTVMVW